LKLTFASELPAFTLTIAGAPGTVAGVTLLEAYEGGPDPILLVAVTVKVQGVPLVSPFTVIGLVGPEAFCPELDVTV
jgi:hypothetical protein